MRQLRDRPSNVHQCERSTSTSKRFADSVVCKSLRFGGTRDIQECHSFPYTYLEDCDAAIVENSVRSISANVYEKDSYVGPRETVNRDQIGSSEVGQSAIILLKDKFVPCISSIFPMRGKITRILGKRCRIGNKSRRFDRSSVRF